MDSTHRNCTDGWLTSSQENAPGILFVMCAEAQGNSLVGLVSTLPLICSANLRTVSLGFCNSLPSHPTSPPNLKNEVLDQIRGSKLQSHHNPG